MQLNVVGGYYYTAIGNQFCPMSRFDNKLSRFDNSLRFTDALILRWICVHSISGNEEECFSLCIGFVEVY